MKTKQLTVNAMLAAMCVVLGYIAIDLGAVKVTFEELPVILAGLMYGPLSGFLVGTIGTLLSQILRYGITATTVLWVLPFGVCGFAAGFAAKKAGFYNTKKQLWGIIAISEALVLAFNTLAIFADAKLFGYYYPAIITGSILIRLGIGAAKTAAFGIFVPPILKLASKITGNGPKKPMSN